MCIMTFGYNSTGLRLKPCLEHKERDMPYQHHPHQRDNLRTAFLLNLSFTILELLGGWWTNSLAILSDAVHDLGDSVSLAVAWYLERVSRRHEDANFSYGYRRFSLLGALINIFVLLVGTGLVLSRAIQRLFQPQATYAPGMVFFAVIGMLVNGIAMLRLRHEKGINAKVIALHLSEDVFGWFAVLVVGFVLLFANLPILDPLLSILISIYVLINVYRNLKATIKVMLQGVPENLKLQTVQEQLQNIEHVHSTHHTHLWSLDGVHHVLTTHVVVDEDLDKGEILEIKEQIRNLVKAYDISHATIDIEFGQGDCVMVEVGD